MDRSGAGKPMSSGLLSTAPIRERRKRKLLVFDPWSGSPVYGRPGSINYSRGTNPNNPGGVAEITSIANGLMRGTAFAGKVLPR